MKRDDPPAAFRGSILHFLADPGDGSAQGSYQYFTDGLLVVDGGRVQRLGPANELLATLPVDMAITDYTGKLILPGFVDTHVHYAQTDVIASAGRDLLHWLEEYTFPEERRFGDASHASAVAGFFLDELMRNGTTTALVFGTVHRQSIDAFFDAAAGRDLRMVAGKVLMDRNCPEYLRDSPESGYVESMELMERWHGQGRLGYAITPRFAVTSSDAQLELAGKLAREHPDAHIHSHVAENVDEVAWVERLFPWSRSYLDVYDRYGLLRERAIYAHCIHLDLRDRIRMAESGAAVAFCPSSNLFLGSGLFDIASADRNGLSIGIGSDVGGGTSFSMLRTLADAYKVAQMHGYRLSSMRAFYFATLGGAKSLGLHDAIGNFAIGKEADFVVLDCAATPLMARRHAMTRTLEEALFALMTLGDDRAIWQTAILGHPILPN
jgi:guanine deaminase